LNECIFQETRRGNTKIFSKRSNLHHSKGATETSQLWPGSYACRKRDGFGLVDPSRRPRSQPDFSSFRVRLRSPSMVHSADRFALTPRRHRARASNSSASASSKRSPSDQIESSAPRSAMGATSCCATSSSRENDVQNAGRRNPARFALICIVLTRRHPVQSSSAAATASGFRSMTRR